ncbi:MAG: Lrp/AsnC family transcriptional regulator [Alphaproteobacteria bacterium]|nr:Lrp/AsnC family transcriptional regulator [Alphaproteobacteria bacterium]
MLKLDDRDLKILSVLQKDGRITKTELAERINLSPTPCWERLKRLEQAGIIEGYEAKISLVNVMPLSTIFMEVSLASHRNSDFALFEGAMGNYDEITECWAVGGGIDYMIKAVCRSVDAYQQLVDRLLEDEIGIQRYFSYVVTKPIKLSPTPPMALFVTE